MRYAFRAGATRCVQLVLELEAARRSRLGKARWVPSGSLATFCPMLNRCIVRVYMLHFERPACLIPTLAEAIVVHIAPHLLSYRNNGA
jgi:hypothetical protein